MNGTFPQGIYGSTVVGYYRDVNGNSHGFMYDGSSFSPLDDPLGTRGTQPTGIFGSTIVGNYRDSSNVRHGFIADVPEPGALAITVLGLPLLLGRMKTGTFGKSSS